MSAGASGGATLMNQFQALLGAVFTAQDIGLDHSNGSSINFESAVLVVGGRVEVVRIARRDLWRNVRIRFLHSLPTYNASSFD
jgi:hypothetical protein